MFINSSGIKLDMLWSYAIQTVLFQKYETFKNFLEDPNLIEANIKNVLLSEA